MNSRTCCYNTPPPFEEEGPCYGVINVVCPNPYGRKVVLIYCRNNRSCPSLIWTQKIGVIGYSISFLSLISACLIFRAFKRLQCTRNFVHINLFASLILRSIMCILTYFLQSDSTEYKIEV
uniref:Uncharacterized protein n=1 Tax=Romanomermis culicivorax TaxID=13658 RepID=A0A915JDZ0_ROMCU